jgi:hypothetical protein
MSGKSRKKRKRDAQLSDAAASVSEEFDGEL